LNEDSEKMNSGLIDISGICFVQSKRKSSER
jgi:hypothetical protein